MYSVPPKPETYGATETILGNWFAQHGQRDKVFLASKIAGPALVEHIFETAIPSLIGEHISQAIDGSLKRLKTDYIDLYQLHWPERHTSFFGTLAYGNQQAQNDYDTTPLEETLLALQKRD
ncbi:aldo/keto reductase [Acinetobacter baumannii]